MGKKEEFLRVFKQAKKKYGKSKKRLAGDGWDEAWKTLIVTIMSAQSRDETTIPIAEQLFKKYDHLKKLAQARYNDVYLIFRSLNYNKTKAKHVIAAARFLIDHCNGNVPKNIDELVKIPGVGRKTANLVLNECHNIDGICVDTHVHRIANALRFVKTRNPYQTELELMKIVPRKYWGRINRIFVLWGKNVPGKDKKKLLEKLGIKGIIKKH